MQLIGTRLAYKRGQNVHLTDSVWTAMQLEHGVSKTNTDPVNILSNLSEKLFSAWVSFLFVFSITDIQIYCLFRMSLRFPFFLSSCKMLPYPPHTWAYAVKWLWEKSALQSYCGTLMTSKQDDSYYFLWLCFIWGADPLYRAYRLQITVVWAEKKGYVRIWIPMMSYFIQEKAKGEEYSQHRMNICQRHWLVE